ncbi:5-formyltetrahydrofolate cyclo-ligase [Microbulbifer yueqingensis]|uniref:5-formyltetrahydrofolate cyclo-ligase n=1 Tax=Microbulbifer yueqingensis TaxID=658219 RepID=A0A1G8YF27_9GAMM|nr:5-formyltetrahydrofolate cyclo-ligase [Microbulbifer yueqingensis]SDK01529.1 5-formyltetrahydrofolate cyclo-ligase [Microbulbifer yueqingensis]
MSESKAELRRTMRNARRGLSVYQQRLAAHSAINSLRTAPEFRTARRVGIYWPMDGELNLLGLARRFPDKRFYLPLLPREPRPHLRFCHWRGGALTFRNRFGIPEPVRGDSRSPLGLDLVLVPLVAFDPSGARLGMGAGFYDRTFAFKRHFPGAGPAMIGAAHQLQCVEHLPTDSWDIPLDAVVTDRRLYRCR